MESDDIGALNSAPSADAARSLELCLDVPRWVDAVLHARPFTDVYALRRAFRCAAAPLTSEEIRRALEAHPRIGDRPTGDGMGAQHARSEQSGVDTSDAALDRRLRAGNLAYEEQFGQVFLIRAAGRDATEVLDELERRLGNDRTTEAAEVESELRDIAIIRATGELDIDRSSQR